MVSKRHAIGFWGILAVSMAVAGLAVHGQSTTTRSARSALEYDLKAAFLLNFAKFVEWPAAAFTDDHSPLVVGVLGEDPFGETMDRIVREKQIKGHPLIVSRWKSGEAPGPCQLLFICRSESYRVAELLRNLGGQSVLLISEIEQFLERGGMINFFTESDQVKFAVNPDAAARAGLIISSKLLNVAKVYGRR